MPTHFWAVMSLPYSQQQCRGGQQLSLGKQGGRTGQPYLQIKNPETQVGNPESTDQCQISSKLQSICCVTWARPLASLNLSFLTRANITSKDYLMGRRVCDGAGPVLYTRVNLFPSEQFCEVSVVIQSQRGRSRVGRATLSRGP